MKASIFSKKELEYLKDRLNLEKSHSKNHIYQLRHSIREKISNFIFNDLKILLNFGTQKNEKKVIIDYRKLEYIVEEILKKNPNFIGRILKLPEVKIYLGVKDDIKTTSQPSTS